MQILVYDLRKNGFEDLVLAGDVSETSTQNETIRLFLKTGYEVVLEANETEQRQFAQLIMARLAELAQKSSGA